MAAGVHDLRIEQGASFYNEVQWLVESKDNPNEFVPVDITAWEIRCQIRARANSPIIIKTVNVQKIDAINGIFAIYLNPVETTNIPTVGAYWKEYELFAYDIEAESGTGVERLLNGKVFVSPNVTRDASTSSGGNIPGGIDTPGGGTETPGGDDDDNPGGQTPGGDDNPGGNPGGSTDPDPSAFFSETITTSEASAWLDTNKYTIPSNMTKLKVTATSSGGGMSIGCITNDEPWAETDDIVTLDLTSGSAMTILAVTAGSTIRPIFNYWSGSGTLTIRLEGSDSINAQSAAGTLAPYLGK